ncbi:MAG: UDP-N-acetylglucosamine 2-epimerase [Alcaligenes nematophilus]|uniref:UDP-N-acetylglucosamine 2-epimerase n=1 Tax=Alcaligenes nematophilus TaxID=2994643 RepID=UPI000B07E6C2|nr:UDP-N-acetylglucosamine 2-epimerase [Alcaligenes faecalis]
MKKMESNALKDKKILFLTGTRADFGKIEPLAKSSQGLGAKISFFITGMHMMRQYGETKLEVKKFKNADFYEFVNQKSGDPLDLILAKTVLGLTDFLHEHKPDLVVIHGDRIEALAGAIVCATNYIRSAHIEGGEVSGTIDESLRHCNSKLCTSHFVSSEAARNLLLSLGEPSNRIFVIGSPELDVHNSLNKISINEVKQYYDIKFNDYGIAIFHPVTSEQETIGKQAENLFNSLKNSNKNFVVILPNNDPGTDLITHEIAKLDKNRFKIIPSMRFNYFSELMKNAKLVIGNSSAGVREAPFMGIPSIDIGSRQAKRSLSQSVFWCNALDTETIEPLIQECWGKKFDPNYAYGDGNSTTRFLNTLTNQSYWMLPLQKSFESSCE